MLQYPMGPVQRDVYVEEQLQIQEFDNVNVNMIFFLTCEVVEERQRSERNKNYLTLTRWYCGTEPAKEER